MPTNDTSDVLVIGPDVDGKYLTVAPGEKYTQPKPPRTVADDEADAARAAEAVAAETPKPDKPAKPSTKTPAPEGDPA